MVTTLRCYRCQRNFSDSPPVKFGRPRSDTTVVFSDAQQAITMDE